VLLNGHELIEQKDAIPEGTYLLPFHPSLLRYDEHGVPQNTIGLRTRHMPQAHYSTAAGFRLTSQQSFMERLVVAESQEAADAIMAAETADVNHNRPDVGLFADLKQPPMKKTPEVGTEVSVPLKIGNLSDTSATGLRIEIYDSEPGLAENQVGPPIADPLELEPLEPMDLRDLTVRFTYGGKQKYFVVVRSDGEDFDLTNNVHLVYFVQPELERVKPYQGDTQTDLLISLFDGPEQPFMVRFLDEESGEEVARAIHGKLDKTLPTGRYRRALKHYQWDGHEVQFPDVIEHKEGEPLHLNFNTSLELDTSTIRDIPWRWAIVRAGRADEVVQYHSGEHSMMLLPPGDYNLALQPTQYEFRGSQRVVFPQTITVEAGETKTVRLDSGIRLELPQQCGELYGWAAVKADDPDEVVQWHFPSRNTMLLPPGDYNLALQPTQYEFRGSQRIVFPAKITVKAGTIETVRLDSGIRLELPKEAGELYAWQAVNADDPDDVVQWHFPSRNTMLLPPGVYNLALKPTKYDGGSQRVVFPAKITVKAGTIETVRLDSGIRLELPQEAGAIWGWQAVNADDPDDVVQWHFPSRNTMLLPPGVYNLALKPTQFDGGSQRVVFPQKITVAAGKINTIRLDSGIQLELPKDAGKINNWQLVKADNTDKVIQWHFIDRKTMLVPPGDYKIALRPYRYGSGSRRRVWPETYSVNAAEIRKVVLKSGLRFAGNDDDKPKFLFQIFNEAGDQSVWSQQRTWDIQLLPPGTYTVKIKSDGEDTWVTLPKKVVVETDKVAEVELDE
jgi:hypothetical protein